MKGFLAGTAISKPEESRNFVRFLVEFAPHEQTEVTVGGRLRELARGVRPGERIVISEYANIGYLKIVAKQFIRTFGQVPVASG